MKNVEETFLFWFLRIVFELCVCFRRQKAQKGEVATKVHCNTTSSSTLILASCYSTRVDRVATLIAL